jgi:hypothetical protein
MRPVPDLSQVLLATFALLLQLLVDLGCLGGLVEDFARGRRPGDILVRSTSQLVPWALDAAVVSRLQISRRMLERLSADRGHASGGRVKATERLHRVRCSTEIVGVVTRVGAGVGKSHGACVRRLGGGCFSRFRSAWSLLSRGVLLCEALLTGLALPVVVAHSSSVVDQSAPKLPEHGPCGDDGNLARAVRVR